MLVWIIWHVFYGYITLKCKYFGKMLYYEMLKISSGWNVSEVIFFIFFLYSLNIFKCIWYCKEY